MVAVQSLNLHQFSKESDKSFYKEVKTLNRLRPRNIVKVLGYAWETRKLKATVLEFMENGNLETVIHDSEGDRSRWSLADRIDVLVSISTGLVYLHTGYDFPIVHCDLKPSNVLFDGNWVLPMLVILGQPECLVLICKMEAVFLLHQHSKALLATWHQVILPSIPPPTSYLSTFIVTSSLLFHVS